MSKKVHQEITNNNYFIAFCSINHTIIKITKCIMMITLLNPHDTTTHQTLILE